MLDKAYLFIKRSHLRAVDPWVGHFLFIEYSRIDTHLPKATLSRRNHASLNVVDEKLDVICIKVKVSNIPTYISSM